MKSDKLNLSTSIFFTVMGIVFSSFTLYHFKYILTGQHPWYVSIIIGLLVLFGLLVWSVVIYTCVKDIIKHFRSK